MSGAPVRTVSRAGEEAARWLLRGQGVGAAWDEAEFDAWLRADRSHVEAWGRAQRSWAALEPGEGDGELDALRRDALRTRRDARPWGWAAAMAAGLVLAVMGAVVLMRPRPELSQEQAAVAAPAKAYATAVGERRSILLADGSRVVLDTASAVEVTFGAHARDVRLQRGRAYFMVAHDPSRPFTVAAGAERVTAVGTRFDVRIDPTQVQVVMAEGQVEVRGPGAGGRVWSLRAGQALSSGPGSTVRVSSVDPAEAMLWRSGQLSFRDTPLAEAAAELNRYTRTQLIVRDPAVAALRISGTFRAGDPARFGRTVEAIYPVHMRARGDGALELVSGG